MQVAVICKEGLGSGFKLAGAEVLVTPDSEAARAELRELLGSQEYGLVLIEQDLLDELDDRTLRTVEASNVPLVVPFPSLHPGAWERDERSYIQEMVRRAIGFTVRI